MEWIALTEGKTLMKTVGIHSFSIVVQATLYSLVMSYGGFLQA